MFLNGFQPERECRVYQLPLVSMEIDHELEYELARSLLLCRGLHVTISLTRARWGSLNQPSSSHPPQRAIQSTLFNPKKIKWLCLYLFVAVHQCQLWLCVHMAICERQAGVCPFVKNPCNKQRTCLRPQRPSDPDPPLPSPGVHTEMCLCKATYSFSHVLLILALS